MGIGYDEVSKDKPDIVYSNMTALGGPKPGPWMHYPGFDPMVQGSVGIQMRYAGEGNRPILHGWASCIDYITGYSGTLGAALALFRLKRSGASNGGAYVQTSLAQGGQLVQAPFMYSSEKASSGDEPQGQDAVGEHSLHRIYQASDGSLFLAGKKSEVGLLSAVPGLTGVPVVGGEDESERVSFLEGKISEQPVKHWVEAFLAAGLGCHRDVLAFKKKLRTKTYTTPTKKVKTRTNTTESMYVRSLRTAFNRAVKWEYIEKNPFNSVEVPTYRETRRRNKDMSIQEVRQLLQTIDAAGKVQFAQYVRCVLYTGGRRNELLFVRGEDVDMEKRVLTVTVTKRKGGPVRLKIPINDALYNVLRTMEIKRGQYLFKTDNNSRGARDKGKAWHPSYVTDEFKKMVTKAGLPDHYSLHSLRHTYVTYLREKGVPIDVIQRLLGHTSSKMTWETYDHTEALSFRQYANLVKFEDEDDAAT